MNQQCTLPRAVTRDITGPEPELIGACAIDVSGCHRFEMSVALNEFEQGKAGLRFETWPEGVRVIVEREIKRWCDAHPDRRLVSITTAASRTNCMVVLHHGAKAGT